MRKEHPRLRLHARSLFAVLRLAVLQIAAVAVPAQLPPPSQPPIMTLHVYTDLVQVPVLVVNDALNPVSHVPADRFSVSLDSGPRFGPRRVRVEGEDAISMAILLDIENTSPATLLRMSDSVSALAPQWLNPRDHVTIFALDCALITSLDDAPAERTALKSGVDRVLESWQVGRQARQPQRCAAKMHLWSAVSLAVQSLARQPGRRVLLVVSDGRNPGSDDQWSAARLAAQAAGVAVFGLEPYPDFFGVYSPGPVYSSARAPGGPAGTPRDENQFHLLCELTGGIVLQARPATDARQLARILNLIRGRYIIEFSRPRQDIAGAHDMQISVAHTRALVRPAGVSITIPDATSRSDPNTIQRDTRDAPELGNRRILPVTPSPAPPRLE